MFTPLWMMFKVMRYGVWAWNNISGRASELTEGIATGAADSVLLSLDGKFTVAQSLSSTFEFALVASDVG